MNKCCSQKDTTEHYPKSHHCPVNGESYASVKRKTLLHHVSQPWLCSLPEQGYYFCSNPDCDVVYFGQDNTVVHKSELRTDVGQKSHDRDAAICYCFGVSKALVSLDKNIKNFITQQTKESLCSCETSNPSGRCCLKDFPGS